MLLSFVLGYVTCSQVKLNVEYPKDIVAESLTIRSDDPDSYKVGMSANHSIGGIWIYKPGKMNSVKPMVAIYNEELQGAVLGAYGATDKPYDRFAMEMAIGANDKSFMQYKSKDGSYKNLLEGK